MGMPPPPLAGWCMAEDSSAWFGTTASSCMLHIRSAGRQASAHMARPLASPSRHQPFAQAPCRAQEHSQDPGNPRIAVRHEKKHIHKRQHDDEEAVTRGGPLFHERRLSQGARSREGLCLVRFNHFDERNCNQLLGWGKGQDKASKFGFRRRGKAPVSLLVCSLACSVCKVPVGNNFAV